MSDRQGQRQPETPFGSTMAPSPASVENDRDLEGLQSQARSDKVNCSETTAYRPLNATFQSANSLGRGSRAGLFAHGVAAIAALAAATNPHIQTADAMTAAAIYRPAAASAHPQPPASSGSHFKVSTICTKCAPFTHAASLVRDGNELLAFWYQGVREGGHDVAIRSARYDGSSWSNPETVVDQLGVARELGRFVKSVGNPVAFAGADGKLSLFFVVVAMRGWATSYIAVKQSVDGGRTWSPARPLVTSPIWNLSTMTKTTPFALDNGRIALPAYWLLGTGYPVIIELSPGMQVLDVNRLTPRGTGIQPAVAAAGGNRYVALLRSLQKDVANKGLRSVVSTDKGETWSAPRETGFGNPGAPVSVLSIAEDQLALIFNDKDEDSLSVTFSKDGGATWDGRVALPGDPQKINTGMAYPYAVASGEGLIDLVYSCAEYTAVCHTRFSRSWAEQRQ